jgi:hypothetical protein
MNFDRLTQNCRERKAAFSRKLQLIAALPCLLTHHELRINSRIAETFPIELGAA